MPKRPQSKLFPRPDSRSIQREIDAEKKIISSSVDDVLDGGAGMFARDPRTIPENRVSPKTRSPKVSQPPRSNRIRRPDLEHIAEIEPVRSVFDISKTPNSPPWDRVREVLQDSYPAERYLLVGLHFSSKDGAEVVTLTIKKDPRS